MTAEANPGILDFQDAVRGAVTYDLVSLLKDCYIAWPDARVNEWAAALSRAAACGPDSQSDADEGGFIRWFDLMGLQRHIKVLGIFARLYYRDGKSGLPQGSAAGARPTRMICRRRAIRKRRDSPATSTTYIGPRFEAAQRRAGAPT